MNNKLFLASTFKDVVPLFKNFEKNLEGKTVTFIPTASVIDNLGSYIEDAKKLLEDLGLIVDVLELTTATTQEVDEKLAKNDIIYVLGGNTFYLLQEMRRSGADKVIQREVQAGKLYVGESTGAIITAPNIYYSRAMDRMDKAPDLNEDYDGLNLVDFYVVPHYKNKPFVESSQEIVDNYLPSLKIIPISDNEAILVHNDVVRMEKI